jgi:hypothetical protein
MSGAGVRNVSVVCSASAVNDRRRPGTDARPAGTEHGRELPAVACRNGASSKAYLKHSSDCE